MRLVVALALVVAAVFAFPVRAPLLAEPATDSRLHWITNGPVNAGAVVGDRLFIGGAFTRVAPTSAALGAMYTLDRVTGAVRPGLPLVDGEIHDVEPDGTGGYYVAGDFGHIGSVARRYLARIRADGTVDPAFAPAVTMRYNVSSNPGFRMTLARTATTLYFAGPIAAVDDTFRGPLVALDPATGQLTGWATNLFYDDATVQVDGGQVLAVGRTLDGLTAASIDAVSGITRWQTVVSGNFGDRVTTAVAGTRFIVGGGFARIDDHNVRSLAAVDLVTGALEVAWRPDTATDSVGLDARHVETLAVVGGTLYAGGTFTQFGGQARANLAAVDVAGGTVTGWAPSADGPVSALVATPAGVIAGGAFSTVNGAARDKLAEIDAAGGTTSWQSAAYPTSVRTLWTEGTTLGVAGRMGLEGGGARRDLAGFDLTNDALLPWTPPIGANESVAGMAASAAGVFLELVAPGGVVPVTRLVGVSIDTGASVWTQQPAVPVYGVRMLAAAGPYVYAVVPVSPGLVAVNFAVRRLDAQTGEYDPSWTPLRTATQALIDDGTMYLGYGSSLESPGALRKIDLATGTSSPWAPIFGPIFPEPPSVFVRDLAIDGGTIVVSAGTSGYGLPRQAFDTVSGMPVSSNAFSNTGGPPSIAVADGDTIVATHLAGLPGTGVSAYDASGMPRAWSPELSPIPTPNPLGAQRTPVLTTPSDVIVLGHGRVAPSVIHGIAVFPRTPAVAPQALRWSAVGNVLTFSWRAPTPAPSGYVLTASTDAGGPPAVTLPLGPVTTFSTPAPAGTFFVRVRSAGTSGPAAVPTNEVAVSVGCSAPPPPPLGLATSLAGSLLTFSWTAPPFATPTGYLLEAGVAPGGREITLPLGGTATSFSAAAPPGTYYVRVRAVNDCGAGAATPEVVVTVGAGALPPTPSAPDVTVTGSTVSLQWPVVPGAIGYVLEAGTGPRLADILTLPVAEPGVVAPGVPWGYYYVRVRARSAAGLGPASADRLVTVGLPSLP